MEIGTYYAQFSQSTLLSSLGVTGTASTGLDSSSTTSLFGPAATLSLGGSSKSSTGGYSQLASVVPQIDLAGIYAARTAAAQPQVSPAARKQELAALERVAWLVEQRQYSAAREAANEIVQKNPSSGAAVHALGVVEMKERNYDKAEQLFLRSDYLAPGAGFDEDAEVARHLQKSDDEVVATAERLVGAPDTRRTGLQLLVGLTERNPVQTGRAIAAGRRVVARRRRGQRSGPVPRGDHDRG